MRYYIDSELNYLGIAEYIEDKTKNAAIKRLMFIYGISKKQAEKIIIK